MLRLTDLETIDPGRIKLSGRPSKNGETCKIIFKCRKNNFDYLGQVKINTTEQYLRIELFNENYFSLFAEPKPEITASLENQLLEIIVRTGTIHQPFHSLVKSRIEATHNAPRRETETLPERIGESEVDLQALFDHLNEKYFQGRIRAKIEWGNGYGKRNKRSFRFGSYDLKKKIIHINPVLKQGFVPPAVLELTVYHEMCHQYFSPVKQKGKWRYHHPEFKKKEREHPHYREVRLWEKKHWTRLLSV